MIGRTESAPYLNRVSWKSLIIYYARLASRYMATTSRFFEKRSPPTASQKKSRWGPAVTASQDPVEELSSSL